jgi:hypothetical protein
MDADRFASSNCKAGGVVAVTRPLTRDVRKAIPLSVKLAVALRMLGFEGPVDFDHDPALALREWDEAAGDFIPPQHDPNFIVIRTKAEHRAKTGGRKGEQRSTSYGSDQHAIAKLDRLTEDQQKFRQRLLAKDAGERVTPPRKCKIPSRPFPKGRSFRRHP